MTHTPCDTGHRQCLATRVLWWAFCLFFFFTSPHLPLPSLPPPFFPLPPFFTEIDLHKTKCIHLGTLTDGYNYAGSVPVKTFPWPQIPCDLHLHQSLAPSSGLPNTDCHGSGLLLFVVETESGRVTQAVLKVGRDPVTSAF